MNNKILPLYIILFCLIPFTKIFAQNEYKLDDIIVTSGRTPSIVNELTRNVLVLTSAELENLPVNSVHELINYIAGVDLKQRGANGMQSDLAIRGGTFEQSLVMINGTKIIDPQTGHHNLNIPITVEDIERIEIVKGQASKSFGSNAFSGVINFITKTDFINKMTLSLAGGESGYANGLISAAYIFSNISNSITFEKSRSDGYRFNTGYDRLTFNYSSAVNLSKARLNLMFGYSDNDFGANSFYSIRFPKQAERVTTKILTLSGGFETGGVDLSPKLFWRNNNDKFMLDKDNPEFYMNLHESNSYGAEFQASFVSTFGSTVIGFEYNKDKLISTNLGIRSREKKGVFFEQVLEPYSGLNINLGGFVSDYSGYGWKIFPGLDAGVNLSDNTKIFFSAGKAFRIPTYTELFYNDPVTQGNPDLRPEEVINYETGLRYRTTKIDLTISVFMREGENIIDWVRQNEKFKWTVENIAEAKTSGAEINFSCSLNSDAGFVKNITFGYTYLTSDKITRGLESRYTLDHLKHQAAAGVSGNLTLGISQNWNFRYEERYNSGSHFIVDMQLKKNFQLFDFWIKALNLFNISYKDFADVPLPGRCLSAGLKFSLQID